MRGKHHRLGKQATFSAPYSAGALRACLVPQPGISAAGGEERSPRRLPGLPAWNQEFPGGSRSLPSSQKVNQELRRESRARLMKGSKSSCRPSGSPARCCSAPPVLPGGWGALARPRAPRRDHQRSRLALPRTVETWEPPGRWISEACSSQLTNVISLHAFYL